jgi:hypothetical protein
MLPVSLDVNATASRHLLDTERKGFQAVAHGDHKVASQRKSICGVDTTCRCMNGVMAGVAKGRVQ